ncbi:hypothetical protein CBR_g41264 [Chara braunii]|uniref:RED-like N-terminal domain-containing protein n=1 Tax=Chara braunii TaxID=69332 RepID=A0A388LVC3_CHABU|nr:hypothetical protein CBR_g41264 [Chara braunii]|eukprot:GBG86270.1 hypothetical protein CBR_g41264 [Chara braunii]
MSGKKFDRMSEDQEEGVTASNPLPPPPRPPGSRTRAVDREDKEGGAAGVHDTPPKFGNLSNDDFRRMVMDTPRKGGDERSKQKSSRSKRGEDEPDDSPEKRAQRKVWPKPKEEEKPEEALPAYRDRAKERREDQNPDYEQAMSELGSLHAVAPPGTTDLRTSDAHRISIENSKFLGGDVEHTHLVKGLDYALLQKVRSELERKRDGEDEDFGDKKKKERLSEEKSMTFRTALGKSVYKWIIKPNHNSKPNEMFLLGRTAFLFDMDEEFAHEIPTTVHRSKADCPPPQETLVAGVDRMVLDRISKIMSYLRLGVSGKVMKKKKKDKDKTILIAGIPSLAPEELVADERFVEPVNGRVRREGRDEATAASSEHHEPASGSQHASLSKEDSEDIFEEAGKDYTVTTAMDRRQNRQLHRQPLHSPESMDESPRRSLSPPRVRPSRGGEGDHAHERMQGSAAAGGGHGEWQEWGRDEGGVGDETGVHWGADQTAGMRWKQDPYQQFGTAVGMSTPGNDAGLQMGSMTQEEKDRGMGSVFKRDDQRLQRMREKDSREKDPNFISESYSECYPGYQEYNREVMDESDDEEDLTKMDMGAKAKGRLHRWDFDTEEEWSKYNEAKEAMPKAAFQFGVKMADGRKTRKNKDQKLNNELHRIQQIIKKKKEESTRSAPSESPYAAGSLEESESQHPGKRIKF